MANVKFSQFTNGSTMKVGDQVVGLRTGANTRFAFPGAGIQDANAVNLITWTGVASAVNYMTIVNAIAGAGPTIGTAGVSAAIPLTLTTTGAANIILDPASTGVISALANIVMGSGLGLATGTTVGNTALLQAYNTGGGTYTTFGTLTAGTTPSLAFGLISATNLNLGFRTTATAGATTTLTVADTQIQEFTGTLTQTVVMPVTSTLTLGQQYYIINNSSGVVTVQSSGANTIQAMAAGTSLLLTVILTSGTTAASWQASYIVDSGGSGTVNAGTANQLAYYATTGTAVSGLTGANSALLVTNSTGVPAMTASLTDGQVIVGSTGATPVPATLTAGSNIAISNAAGSITISSTGGSGYVWSEVTGTSQAMAVDNAYIASNAGLVTLTLPSTAAVGDTLIVQGKGTGGWLIAQNASQQIHLGSSATTVGVGGSLASTNQWDSIELVCVTANNIWASVTGPMGIITVV